MELDAFLALIDYLGQYGVAAAIALYMVRWVTGTLERSLREIGEALRSVSETQRLILEELKRLRGGGGGC